MTKQFRFFWADYKQSKKTQEGINAIVESVSYENCNTKQEGI